MATTLSAFWNSLRLADVTSETAGRDCLQTATENQRCTRNEYILDHVGNDAVRFSRSSIFRGCSIPEHLQSSATHYIPSTIAKQMRSRIALYTMSLAKICFFHTVHLGKLDVFF